MIDVFTEAVVECIQYCSMWQICEGYGKKWQSEESITRKRSESKCWTN